LRGRDAGNFGRWLGERSDVTYPIMSDEQRPPATERPASLRVAAKIAAEFVEGLDRVLPIRTSPFSCPASDFGCNAARGNNEF
jgi:hypothetical protein